MAEITLYDVRLRELDLAAPKSVFETSDGQQFVFPQANDFHKLGSVGTLIHHPEKPGEFRFHAYLEQRLRRVPSADTADRFAWTINGADVLLVKSGVIPGKDGVFIAEDTLKVTLDVPSEFRNLCAERGLSVEVALRGLIADVCVLHDFIANPREDGFSSNGSDERRLAYEWFDRAYPYWDQ